MTRIVLIAIVAVAVVGIGATLWMNASGPVPSAAGRDFLAVPRDYDTTGGQQIQPRWNETEEAADGPAN